MDSTAIIIDKMIKSNQRRMLYLWIVNNNLPDLATIIHRYADGQKYDIKEVIEQFKIAYSKCPDIIKANQEWRELNRKPKCPTCGSQCVKKLGVFYSTGFAPKYFECMCCGYRW